MVIVKKKLPCTFKNVIVIKTQSSTCNKKLHFRVQRGLPIVYHCQIQRSYPCFAVESLSDWVAVRGIHLARSRDGSEWGRGGARQRWHCPCITLCGLFSWAGCGKPAVWPGKGQACQTGSVCMYCCVAPLECAVSQGRSGAGRPALFRGFFFFGRNIPISAVLLSCFVESVMSAEWLWLAEQVVFLSGDFRGLHWGELLDLFLILHVH